MTISVIRQRWRPTPGSITPICLLIEERGANSDELRRQPLAVFSDSTRGRPHSNSSASSCIRQRRDRGGGEGSGREKKKQKVW